MNCNMEPSPQRSNREESPLCEDLGQAFLKEIIDFIEESPPTAPLDGGPPLFFLKYLQFNDINDINDYLVLFTFLSLGMPRTQNP